MPPTPYQQIAEHYRDKIRSGALRSGDRLPSTRAMATRWDSAHNTAMRALGMLQSEGLIRILPRSGAVVTAADSTTSTPCDRVRATQNGGEIYPLSDQARVIEAAVVPAPRLVADVLGVEVDAPVVKRSRVTLHDDLPVTLSTSWFPGTMAETAPALLDTDRIPGGTIRLIAELTGRSVACGRDLLCARAAPIEAAQHLGVGEGTPVLYGRNWWLDEEDALIEFGEFWVPPDRTLAYPYTCD